MEEDLIDSVRERDIVKLDKLLTNDNSNTSDISERTLLIIATQNRDIDAVYLLLKKGGNPTIRDNDEKSAIDYAIENKDYDILRLLLNKTSREFRSSIHEHQDPETEKLIQYPLSTIPSILSKKKLIEFLFKIQDVLAIPQRAMEYLKIEYGEETLNKFSQFLLNYCHLADFFPRIIYLAAGVYGAAFSLCVTDVCDPPMALKIIPYKLGSSYSGLTIHDPTRPENVEWEILKLINRLFEKLSSPPVLIAYESFMCENYKSSPFNSFLKRFINHHHIQQFYLNNWFRLSFTEFAESGTLHDFIVESTNTQLIKSLILQCVLAMAMLLEKEPGFRHNDFHMGNLLLRKREKNIYSKFENKKYIIKSPRVQVLINDFDFAFVNPNIINAKYNFLYKHIPNPSPYSDMFKFFNHLGSSIKDKNQPDIYNFANYVLPSSKFMGHTASIGIETVVRYYALDITEAELSTIVPTFNPKERYPSKLLRHSFFDEFRI